jgi:hypothetical protein
MANRKDTTSAIEELQYLLRRADSILLTANGMLREIILQLRQDVIAKLKRVKAMPAAETRNGVRHSDADRNTEAARGRGHVGGSL